MVKLRDYEPGQQKKAMTETELTAAVEVEAEAEARKFMVELLKFCAAQGVTSLISCGCCNSIRVTARSFSLYGLGVDDNKAVAECGLRSINVEGEEVESDQP